MPDTHATTHVLCDLDGVVWLDRRPVPGAPDAVARLRAAGRRVLFVTNNSMARSTDQEAALAAIGIPAVGDVVTSAGAAASLAGPGERVLVCGADGLVEAVEARGATVIRVEEAVGDRTAPAVDKVVVGLHRSFDYRMLHTVASAVRRGARFVATNDDATFPTPDGPIPGAGALVAAVSTASGVAPEIAGKPHAPMAALVAARCGPGFAPGSALVVGDRCDTDGRFADALGCRFALVRSGVTPPGATVERPCHLDLADLATVVSVLLAGEDGVGSLT